MQINAVTDNAYAGREIHF